MRLRKRRPGDPFQMTAAEFNAIVDAVDFTQGYRNGGSPVGDLGAPAFVEAKNVGDAALAAHTVVQLNDPVLGPTDNVDEFRYSTTLSAQLPIDAPEGQIGITIDPMGVGDIGRVAVAGHAVVQILVTDPGAEYASEVPDQAYLETTPRGPCRIIWRELGGSGGVKWAVVRFEWATYAEFDAVPTASSARGTTPQSWDYTIKRADLDASTNTWSAASGAPGLAALNKAEATAAYQHGQSLSPAGATLTPSAVQGPVNARFVKWHSGARLYTFDAPNPMAITCP